MLNKDKLNIMVDIAERAEKMNLLFFDRISLIMDLECALNEFDLKLNELLNASNFDFTHDINGIQHHLNRQTKEFTNLFVPRFSNN